jgi:hypothetical protein
MAQWRNLGNEFRKEIPISKKYSIQINIEENAIKEKAIRMFIWNTATCDVIDHIVTITKPDSFSFIDKLLRRKPPLSLEEKVFNTFNALKQRINNLEGLTEDPLVTELKHVVDTATTDASKDV